MSEAQTRTEQMMSKAKDIVNNTIIPAAHQAVETGKPVAIKIGRFSFNLAVHVARELLSSPMVQAGIVYGYFHPNQMEPETWSHMLHRFLDGVSMYPQGIQPPRQLTQHEQFIRMIRNMYEWGAYGATKQFQYTWILKLSRIIFNSLEEEEGEQPNSLRALLRQGMDSLQDIWNVYNYVRTPISSMASTAARTIGGPVLEPLLRRAVQRTSKPKPSPPVPEQSSPNRGRSSSPAAAPSRSNTHRRIRGKTAAPKTTYASVEPAASSSVPAPTVRRRIPNKAPNERSRELSPVRGFTRYEKGWQTRRANQAKAKAQASSSSAAAGPVGMYDQGSDRATIKKGGGVAMTAPLVNYGSGMRQSRRGGARTIQGMAPVLEFNEAADDPYVMRPKVQ